MPSTTSTTSTSSTSEPLASSSRQSRRARAPPARFGVQATFPTRKKRKVHFETSRDSKKSKKLTHAEKKQKRKEMLQKKQEKKLRKLQIAREQANYKYVRLDRENTAKRLTLSDDFFTVEGFTGYRLSRCTHGIHHGSWYCEMTINAPGAHILSSFQTKGALAKVRAAPAVSITALGQPRRRSSRRKSR